MRLLAGLAVGVAAAAAAATARAQTPDPVKVALEWHRTPAADACNDGASMQRAVEKRLGRTVFVKRDKADVVVVVRLDRSGDGAEYGADIELETAHGQSMGTRDVRTPSADCAALDESLALVLALMVDIPRTDVPAPPAPPVPSASPAPAAPKPGPTTPIHVPERPSPPWRFEPRVGGVAALGFLPGLALGASAGVAVSPPLFWRTELDATVWRDAEATNGASGSRFRLATVGLRVCPIATRGVPRLQACVGQELGELGATGFGFDQDRAEKRFVYTVALRMRAGVPIWGPLALQAGMGLDLPVTRDRFSYTRADGSRTQLFRMAPAIGRAELGFALELP